MAGRERLLEVTILEELANGGGWRFAFTADTPEKFNYAVSALKANIHPGMRKWMPDERCWWISSPGMMRMYDLFADVREAMNNHAAHRSQGQQQQYRQSRQQSHTRGNVAPVEVAEAFVALYLLPSAPLAVIKAAYRALAVIHHPDHGGNPETMKRLNLAHEAACKWANKTAGKAG